MSSPKYLKFPGNFEYNTPVKVCTRCKTERNLSDFNYKIKSLGKLSPHCRECSRNYIRIHYSNNKDYYIKKAKKRNLKLRELARNYIFDYLSRHPCVDCGERDILVLEFDHIRDKLDHVSHMIRNYASLEKLKSEISKCEVRCANCHRRKTALQFGWFKNKDASVA